jgi:phosphatidate cytidylyltransferase
MLKYRVITALVLIPLVIGSIFFLPPMTFLSVALLIILLAGWEWTQLAGISQLAKKCIFLVLLALALLCCLFIPLPIIVLAGVIWWAIAITLLFLYPKASSVWGNGLWIRAMMGFLVLSPCWLGLIILQGFSPMLLLFCLILIWGVDTAAYFVGRKWGTHKLAPTISPGKSYEGLLAGLLAAVILSGVGLWVLEIPREQWGLFLLICIVGGGIITVIGDLFESMLKRQSHIKDSGSILPGHGGILDRIDSMTTAIPFFALVFPYFFNT